MHYIISIFLFVCSCNLSMGQFANLDETFSNTGVLDLMIDNYPSYATSIATDNQDRIIVAGYISGYNIPINNTGFIARYSSSGVLDETFGDNGIFKIRIDGQSIINDIKFHKDAIVFSGVIYHSTGNTAELYIGKLTEAGILDNSFGDNGIVKSGLSAYILSCGSTSIDVDARDQISAVWYNKENIIYVNRYLWNGQPSSTFNETGALVKTGYVCTVHCKPTYSQKNNSEFLIAGSIMVDNVNYIYESFISFYDSEGIFVHEVNLGRIGSAQVVSVDDAGNWYVAYLNYSAYSPFFYVVKIKPDGNIDSDFGQNGKATIDMPQNVFSITELVIKGNSVYVCGETENQTNVFLVAIPTDGVLNENFEENNVLVKQIESKNQAAQLILSNDDKDLYLCVSSYNSTSDASLFALKYSMKDAALSVEDKHQDSPSILFYPNPCEDALHISFKNIEKHTLKIIDSKGVLLYNNALSTMNEVIDMTDFIAGIYIAIIEDEIGNSIKQIILKKQSE